MITKYNVAGHCFAVKGDWLCGAVAEIPAFAPFEVAEGDALFSFEEGSERPEAIKTDYSLLHEGVETTFGTTPSGYLLTLRESSQCTLHLWCTNGDNKVYISGHLSLHLFHFALWVGYSLMTLPYETVAIHSSCIVNLDKAVLFLGESGTGKSTHTSLWLQHIPGSSLLNDDSPIVRCIGGTLWVYGSPWSGKTPCYKPLRYELKGCVRLSQAPENSIHKLSVLHSYAALHPSFPPQFAYDNNLYDYISKLIEKVIQAVPVYHLACLPNRDAASLSYRKIFSDAENT